VIGWSGMHDVCLFGVSAWGVCSVLARCVVFALRMLFVLWSVYVVCMRLELAMHGCASINGG
jgi:hypothetical protein